MGKFGLICKNRINVRKRDLFLEFLGLNVWRKLHDVVELWKATPFP